MEDDHRAVYAYASSRNWLHFAFSQADLPPHRVYSATENRLKTRQNDVCSGLSFIWCRSRLAGPAFNWPARRKDAKLAEEAAWLQQWASDEGIHSLADMEPAGFDTRASHAQLASYPMDWTMSKARSPLEAITRMWDGPSGGRRVGFAAMLGIKRGSEKEPHPVFGTNWGHAITFEANGPGLTLFDPNFGEFRTTGADRLVFLDWFFGKAVYRYLDLKFTYVYRVRTIG